MGKKILILGGAGYLGARLAEMLLPEAEIHVTSRTVSSTKDAWLSKHPGIRWMRFDSEAAANFPSKDAYDCIINLATPSASEASKSPEITERSALATVDACTKWLSEGRTERLVHFSSFHVYGAHGQAVFAESDALRPSHKYGEIHARSEEHLTSSIRKYPVYVLRLTNAIARPAHADLGPQSQLLVLDCCKQAATTGKIQVRSHGRAYRDFVTVEDVFSAVKIFLEIEGDRSGIYNLSSGNSISLRELIPKISEEARRLLGKEISVEWGSAEDSYPKPFQVDSSRLQKLGWSPRLAISKEIASTISFFVDNP